jgi:hypothetical protein
MTLKELFARPEPEPEREPELPPVVINRLARRKAAALARRSGRDSRGRLRKKSEGAS